jgi:hypothetical protein
MLNNITATGNPVPQREILSASAARPPRVRAPGSLTFGSPSPPGAGIDRPVHWYIRGCARTNTPELLENPRIHIAARP